MKLSTGKSASKKVSRPYKKTWATWIASGLGLGFLPLAPGTWGSLAGIPLGIWLLHFPVWASVLFCFALALAFSPIVKKATLDLDNDDAPQFILDEIIGQAVSLLSLKKFALVNTDLLPVSYIVWSFVLFRIFDIFKPFPANLLDRQKTVFGLFGDDLVAGLYAALVLRGIIRLLPAL